MAIAYQQAGLPALALAIYGELQSEFEALEPAQRPRLFGSADEVPAGTSAAAGDFGDSLRDGQDVAEVIWQRLPRTVLLMGMAMALQLLLGLSLGVLAALKRNTWFDTGFMGLAFVGISVPTFVPLETEISGNFWMNNYNPQEATDNDDGLRRLPVLQQLQPCAEKASHPGGFQWLLKTYVCIFWGGTSNLRRFERKFDFVSKLLLLSCYFSMN